MSYTIKKVDDTVERLLLTGLIVSTDVIEGVQDIYKHEFITIPYVKIVAKWCFAYYEEYKKAPDQHIEDIFSSKRRAGLKDETAFLIEEFLVNLSSEYERGEVFNAPYVLDQVEHYFKSRHLSILSEDIQTHLLDGDVSSAEIAFAEHNTVERPRSVGVDPITDEETIIRAFNSIKDEGGLFTMPGALGKFTGSFKRDTLISFLAPEKRGKTYWMMELGMRALRKRCNVAFFEVGDMSEEQITLRMQSYISKRSIEKDCIIKMPIVDCKYNQDDTCDKPERTCQRGVVQSGANGVISVMNFEDVDNYEPCTACQRQPLSKFQGAVWYKSFENKRLTVAEAIDNSKRFSEQAKGKHLRLVAHPSNTVNVTSVKAQLNAWEKEGFIPDVIIIDYADIMAPENHASRMEFRHQINETWKALKSLSQERHCCVITATQANADAYEEETLTESNFSEDKRKYSHVNMVLTINQTDPEEKDKGVSRIGKMFVRDARYSATDTVTVLECKEINRPYLASFQTERIQRNAV